MSPDAHSPAERADAVLRAAEAAAAAAHAEAAAAQAAALPEAGAAGVREAAPPGAAGVPEAPAPPPTTPPDAEAAPPAMPLEAEAEAAPPDGDPPRLPHEAGSPARLLAAAGELDATVAQAHAQLDALEDALERLGQSPPPPQ